MDVGPDPTPPRTRPPLTLRRAFGYFSGRGPLRSTGYPARVPASASLGGRHGPRAAVFRRRADTVRIACRQPADDLPTACRRESARVELHDAGSAPILLPSLVFSGVTACPPPCRSDSKKP